MIPSLISGYPIILPEHRHRFHTEHPDWHKAWLDSIHESLNPDDIVCDVGSEQGDLSALVASWIPDGGVVLVEPQPLFWPTIRETFEANGLKPLKCYVAMASNSESAHWQIELESGWPAISAVPTDNLDPGFYHLNEHGSTPTIELERHWHRATVYIIDVEGAELHALHGLEGPLRKHHPLVWCAVHPEIMRDRYGHDPNELLAFMHRMGYRWDFLGFQGELHFKFSPR